MNSSKIKKVHGNGIAKRGKNSSTSKDLLVKNVVSQCTSQPADFEPDLQVISNESEDAWWRTLAAGEQLWSQTMMFSQHQTFFETIMMHSRRMVQTRGGSACSIVPRLLRHLLPHQYRCTDESPADEGL